MNGLNRLNGLNGLSGLNGLNGLNGLRRLSLFGGWRAASPIEGFFSRRALFKLGKVFDTGE